MGTKKGQVRKTARRAYKPKKTSKWIPFTDIRTAGMKDSDIAKGKYIIDRKNFRWKKK